MKRFLLRALACCGCAAVALGAELPRLLDKAPVLPLALNDDFEFRKSRLFLLDSRFWKPSVDASITFERQRALRGAVTAVDRLRRFGNYYTFYWRTKRSADLIVRLEYRQENLGAYVQAQELVYPGAKGSFRSDFSVVGDDYFEDGKVTAWRAILIENGRIVALNQSFLWN